MLEPFELQILWLANPDISPQYFGLNLIICLILRTKLHSPPAMQPIEVTGVIGEFTGNSFNRFKNLPVIPSIASNLLSAQT